MSDMSNDDLSSDQIARETFDFLNLNRITEPMSAYDFIGQAMELIAAEPQHLYMATWSNYSSVRMPITSTGHQARQIKG